MPNCKACSVEISRGDLCAYCWGDAERAYQQSQGDRACAICKRQVSEDHFAWWRAKGKVTRHRLHKGPCTTVAEQKKTYSVTEPRNGRVPPSWENAQHVYKETRRTMPILTRSQDATKAKFYCWFGKNRRGGFIVGKLTGAAERPQYRAPDSQDTSPRRMEPNIDIATNVSFNGAIHKVNACCKDNAAWFYLRDAVKSLPGKPGAIGQYVGILATGPSSDGRFAEVVVAVNGTAQGVMDDIRSTEDFAAIKRELGAEYDLQECLWYADIDADLLRFAEKHPEVFGDPIPF